MDIGKTLYVTDRRMWRDWLIKHHASASEIWLVTYRKHTGIPTLPYNDAVEEALCFGWIDSIVKRLDDDRLAQRYSPRRKGSNLSPMNRERVKTLIREKRMTEAGLSKIREKLTEDFVIPKDILLVLKKDPAVWKHFTGFPDSYVRIRIGWIEGARRRPDEFIKRLKYFVRMTARNKRFGMVQ